MKTKLIRAISLTAIAVMIGLGFLTNALQTSEPPAWLLRSSIDDTTIQLSVTTNDGELFEDDEFFEFITFTVSEPAYVYLFNISPIDSDAGDTQQVHLLLPNSENADNFFEAGEYTFEDPFVVLGPGGEAYIQAIATPFPLDIEASDVEEFAFLGNNPSLYFQGLQFVIQSKGLTTAEYAADWTSYRVSTGGVMPLAAGSRCSKMQINVPQAEGLTVSYSIDSSCVNGEPISKSFMGPSSGVIAQVREGERTVTIYVSGFERETYTQRVQFGRIAQLDITDLVPAPKFDMRVAPNNPTIWEDVTFSADVKTFREISAYIWDFGDGSDPVEGERVIHHFTEALEYRVKMTIVFSEEDEEGESTLVVNKDVNIGNDPDAGACPPNTFDWREFPTSIIIESLDTAGCVSGIIPNRLINEIGTIESSAKLTNQFEWSLIPDDAELQANLFVRYMIDEQPVDQEARISLLPATKGIFNRDVRIDVPNNAEMSLNLVINLIKNPSGEEISLEVGPFEIFDLPETCDAARLATRNTTTNSTGSMNFFNRETPVEIVFENFNCDAITIDRDSVVIYSNGVEILNLRNESSEVAAGDEVVFTWDQKDSQNVPVGNDLYEIEIETNLGIYVTRVVIVN